MKERTAASRLAILIDEVYWIVTPPHDHVTQIAHYTIIFLSGAAEPTKLFLIINERYRRVPEDQSSEISDGGSNRC